MSAHAKADEWQVGGFQVDRWVSCKCGWKAEHYNRGLLNAVYRAHKAQGGGIVPEGAGSGFGAVRQVPASAIKEQTE